MINCTFENGRKTSLRHVTVVAIIEYNGKILLTRRAKHLLRGGKLTIPGGFMDRDENAQDAVKREILEESGLHPEKIELFRINDNPKRPKEDRQNVDFIFTAQTNSNKTKDNEEVMEFMWVDLASLPDEEEFAFDHRESIRMFLDHLKAPKRLPIIG